MSPRPPLLPLLPLPVLLLPFLLLPFLPLPCLLVLAGAGAAV
jgi:hypothetical protein